MRSIGAISGRSRILACPRASFMSRTRLRPPAPAQRVLRSSTAACASTTRSPRPRPTACRRSRSPTSPTCSGSSSSTRRRARAGVKPIVGCDVLAHATKRERDAAVARAAARADRARAICGCATAHARVPQQPAPRPRRAPPRMVRRRHRRADRAVGRARRRRRAGAAAGQRRLRRRARARDGRRWFPERYYLELQRAGRAGRRRAGRRDGARSRASVACRSSRRIRCSSSSARTSARTRRACASPKATCSPTRAGRGASPPSSISRRRRRWRDSSPTCRRRSRTRVEIAKRCNLDHSARQEPAARCSRRPKASRSTSICATKRAAGLERRLAALYPDAARARAKRGRAIVARLEFETEDHRADGLPRLLPDRRGLHQLGEEQRRAGRAGPRLGRGLARRVQPRHHRPRSAALQPAVRALPQSRARVDARLRHRLLPGRPRPRHRLREAEVRRRVGVADRHVRHDGGEGRGARRRPRARPAATRSATASRS